MKTRSRLLAASLVFTMMAAAACGRKMPPQVPDSPRPEAVRDIGLATRDVGAYLSWPIPSRNVEGKPISPADIQGFRVYRAEIESEKRKARYRLYAEIDLANPSPASVRDGKVYWSDHQLKYGRSYGYQIRAVSTRGGVSAWSEEVRVAPLLSLAVPKTVTAKAGDSQVLISWDPVVTRMDGSHYDGFVGYNLYRRMDDGQYEQTPLNREPLRTNAYTDTAVVNEKTYYYRVRSTDSPALPWKESPDSDSASATPRDMTPPAKPTGLTVVPGVGRVFLTWNENTERDLAGYYIYRSLRSGRDLERITDKVLARTTYSDETAQQGMTYYYAITAVDQSGNESVWSDEKRANVERLR